MELVSTIVQHHCPQRHKHKQDLLTGSQTNGKLERYHRTLKDDINQMPYEVVEDLEAAIRDFVEFYNYRRYHQALRVVTPADVLEGRLEAILAQREEGGTARDF